MVDTVHFGVVLQGVDSAPVFIDLVRAIEAMGFTHLWVTDSSLHARDVFTYLTLAATVTEKITLGSSVTNPLTRHPAISVAAIASVDEISGGRAIFGFGAGDRPVRALGYQPATLRSVREMADVTRKLLRGEHVTFHGEGFSLANAHIRVPVRSDIPIYISASGPKTLELAGEVADGAIVLGGLFREGMEYAFSQLRIGQERDSGRPLDIAVFAYGSLRDDRAEAVHETRSIAAWFCNTAPVYCQLAGMPSSLVETVRAAYDGGEFQEATRAAELVPDDIVAKLALAGTPNDGYEKVRMLADIGVRCINLFPLGLDRRGVIERFAARVMPHFR